MKRATGPAIKKLLEPYTYGEGASIKILEQYTEQASQDVMSTFTGVYCQKIPVGIDSIQFSVISTATKKYFLRL